jgi:hypothetical protein
MEFRIKATIFNHSGSVFGTIEKSCPIEDYIKLVINIEGECLKHAISGRAFSTETHLVCTSKSKGK